MEENGSIDLDSLSPDGWEQLAVAAEAEIARLRAVQTACLRRLDRAQVASADGHRTLTDWTAARLDVSHSTAHSLVRTSRALADLPQTAEALAGGEVSFDRTVELARIATPATEGRLLEDARGWDLTRLRREAARRRRVSREQEQDTARRKHSLVIKPDLFDLSWKLWGRPTLCSHRCTQD